VRFGSIECVIKGATRCVPSVVYSRKMIALLVTSTMLSMPGGHVLDVPKSDQLGVNGIRFALPKVATTMIAL
jgi:hypothetical protein